MSQQHDGQPEPLERQELTLVLERLNQGEPGAYEEMLPLVYRELRRRAQSYLASQAAGHTLQPTALVHEAMLKLRGWEGGGGDGIGWRDSRHFYRAAAEVMRHVLVSHARSKRALKRGGAAASRDPVAVDEIAAVVADRNDGPDWEALDLALAELRARDERRYQVTMLRYFAGLTDAQVAESLGVSEKTVERDWTTARAFLRARMERVVQR
jgi:RNA polymerase sigma factor (TIGR02999 family)